MINSLLFINFISGSATNICEHFLTNKNLISLITAKKDATTPCACSEFDMALDTMFVKVGQCFEEWLFNDGMKQRCCYRYTRRVPSSF
ncbi:hypothetical protein DPMN_023870 [Dreissena polymorpha]|uniref:Uncharacterized protein n=1 Tax=Dreissena polymorpha TaxID=45954 RepID=A0A9D4LN18_DREPO|nr:hypothetical protein DPMN_023870 [Dreissena polymorpha]